MGIIFVFYSHDTIRMESCQINNLQASAKSRNPGKPTFKIISADRRYIQRMEWS